MGFCSTNQLLLFHLESCEELPVHTTCSGGHSRPWCCSYGLWGLFWWSSNSTALTPPPASAAFLSHFHDILASILRSQNGRVRRLESTPPPSFFWLLLTLAPHAEVITVVITLPQITHLHPWGAGGNILQQPPWLSKLAHPVETWPPPL